jgi:GntR family transcriptional regulator
MDARYPRLADRLRRNIINGTWPVGTQLPSLRELRERYKLGRGVVELAVAELRKEGLIEGRRGARPTVTRTAPAARHVYDPREDWPHASQVTARGTRLATQDLADRMQVPLKTRLWWTQVECTDPDQWPAMLLTVYRRGQTVHPHTDTSLLIAVDAFSVAEARVVGLAAGTVALRIARTRYGADGLAVETADLVLRADRWRVTA